MTTSLTKRQQHTYDAIFEHPIAHHLHRRDVNSMLGVLAEVSEEPNGNLKASRNGQTLVLHASRDKNVTATDELMLIRHFLQRSEGPVTALPDDGGHILVVIDHRAARVYKAELHGTVPHRIVPFDPHGFGRNLHYVQDDSNGQLETPVDDHHESHRLRQRHGTTAGRIAAEPPGCGEARGGIDGCGCAAFDGGSTARQGPGIL